LQKFEAAFGMIRWVVLPALPIVGYWRQGRFRRFTRDWIADHNENLDIAWPEMKL